MDTWRKVGLANDRYVHGANIHGSLYGKFYRTDNTVGVLLDMDHGTLSFVLNAYGGHTLDRDAVVNMGIAQSNLGRLVCFLFVCARVYFLPGGKKNNVFACVFSHRLTVMATADDFSRTLSSFRFQWIRWRLANNCRLQLRVHVRTPCCGTLRRRHGRVRIFVHEAEGGATTA